MDQDSRTFVVVGAGLAGAKAAEALREKGFTGRLVLVGEERHRPYERPPLSKEILLGKGEADSAYVHAEDWYEAHDVELRLGTRVTEIDRGAKEVDLAGVGRLDYDALLLATGATPRKLRVDGNDLAGVHYLRRLPDSERLLGELREGNHRVVVVGAGWIGLETAAAAREHGNDVVVVEPLDSPLSVALGPELGGMFADLHREHGVEFRFGEEVSGFTGDGRVGGVQLKSGEEIPADLVIVGVGARPRTDLAEAAGLDLDDDTGGVAVDEHLRTSDPAVYAVGDAAAAYSPLYGRRVRVEHWDNAMNGGPAAAAAMLGDEAPYDAVPYFFSDQYDLGMEFSGLVDGYDDVVYRGDREGREFVAFWLKDGRVVAGMNVNVWDVTEGVQALIRSGQQVDKAKLADPDTELGSLVTGP